MNIVIIKIDVQIQEGRFYVSSIGFIQLKFWLVYNFQIQDYLW